LVSRCQERNDFTNNDAQLLDLREKINNV